MEKVQLSVSDFVALTNQTLEYVYPSLEVVGEVASYKINQSKFVFFDLKDAESTVGCFATVWQMRIPLEDGMKVAVTATPKLTQWGKFSLTVKAVRPVGEGALKKAFELQKAKLAAEGLFDQDRKRALPTHPEHIAVISSKQAAGYADFMKIVAARWPLMTIDVHHVTVQGAQAADDIIQALEVVGQTQDLPEVVVVIRGGGSADDLAVFNDEKLVRAIAASRVPTLTGIGHEIDESLADLVADLSASTPSNAAELLTPDKAELLMRIETLRDSSLRQLMHRFQALGVRIEEYNREAVHKLEVITRRLSEQVREKKRLLEALHPRAALRRGYAIIQASNGIKVGATIHVETEKQKIKAEIQDVTEK